MSTSLPYSPLAPAKPPSRTLFVVSLLTLFAAFPLIFMGGLVTSHGAGLAVPDWPNSYGYNMWLFPPSLWIGGIFYEHTHRLLGTLVGLLAIIHVVIAFVTRPGKKIRVHSVAALLAIVVQGILGGLRVTQVSITLAIIHGIFAQLVLCFLALNCILTSRSWRMNSPLPRAGEGPAVLGQGGGLHTSRLLPLATLALVLIFLQLILGATMRHLGAGLAIPDLPLAYGHVLPPTSGEGLDAANIYRLTLNDTTVAAPVTLGKIWLHFGHRLGAVLVTTAVLILSVYTLCRTRGRLRWVGGLLLPLIATQVTLGLLTVYFRKPADITTLHHSVGALTLMTVFILAVNAAKPYLRRRDSQVEAKVAPAVFSPALQTAR